MTARAIWKNRQAILKALKIDPAERHATYAVEPFRIVEIEGKVWIGGAVGHEAGPCYGDWTPTGDVILWNPRTGVLALHDHDGPALVTPSSPSTRLTIYTDGFAFFRAWADDRAAIAERRAIASRALMVVPKEPVDSGIPGALAIGDLAEIDWRNLGAQILVAGPGIDAKALNKAVFKSAHLPRIESLAA